MSSDALTTLYKILTLEQERGWDNRAVLGGLDRLLKWWPAQARQQGWPEALVQRMEAFFRTYPHLSPQARREQTLDIWYQVREAFPHAPSWPPQGPNKERTPSPEPTPASSPEPQVAPAARRGTGQPAPPWVTGGPRGLYAPVTALQDVGRRRARSLARLGVGTILDLLFLFPRRYDDYSRLKPIRQLRYGEEVTVLGVVKRIQVRDSRNGRLKRVEVLVSDGTGTLQVTWFNQVWIAQKLKEGQPVALASRVDRYLGRLVLNNPEWEPLEEKYLHTNRIVPVYPLAGNLTQRWMRHLMSRVVPQWAPKVPDPLPKWVREQADLPPLSWTLQQMHYPDSWDTLKQAQRRLALEEIFLLQVAMGLVRARYRSQPARVFTVDDAWLEAQTARLSFTLTRAQRKALDHIREDLASGRPMNRLLQGDVGSGKTVVAALAMAMVTREDAQAAMMAPTSILAEQHYRTLRGLLAGPGSLLRDDEIALLVGATPARERRALLEALAEGRIKVLVGTHALLEDPVQFQDLQLVVIDEQHRFGVRQRALLRRKGRHPHLLVMTATPIPRSLALTIYGDLDLTVLDEMPPGRKPVETYLLYPRERERAYAFIRKEVEKGHQAFIIYPFIDRSEHEDFAHVPAIMEAYPVLAEEIFPDLKVGLLHGKMSPDEKEAVMARFRDGYYHILVATPVVEVGVDIPNATVMLIEGAERFGLAQLHQLRGRVGRGGQQAYCILIPSTDHAVEAERLQAMTQIQDGFRLAELDLQQRGPGEFLGTRQAGFATRLRFADLLNVQLIEEARRLARAFLEQDPRLEAPESQALARYLDHLLTSGEGEIS